MSPVKEYVARPDAKKRATLRGAGYPYYQVREYDNGCIVLEPRELMVPEQISARSLAEMDAAIENFKVGEVSEPIDLSAF